ncbi:MAG: hypothetical protein ABJM06_06975 [Gilvibacter sp.]
MNEDNRIKELFDVMKQNDLKTKNIPAFDSMGLDSQKPRIKPWMYGAAAVLLFLVGCFAIFQSPVTNSFEEDFSVSLDLIETKQAEPLLADTPSLFEWEADTDILIKEFDD